MNEPGGVTLLVASYVFLHDRAGVRIVVRRSPTPPPMQAGRPAWADCARTAVCQVGTPGSRHCPSRIPPLCRFLSFSFPFVALRSPLPSLQLPFLPSPSRTIAVLGAIDAYESNRARWYAARCAQPLRMRTRALGVCSIASRSCA